jgi:hypothetical protein
MLFDLRGKRRRAVQGTYLALAFLMGGGLVFFGIGGGTAGGLLDAFKGGGHGSGNSLIEKRIKREERLVRLNPRNITALEGLVRDNYQLASEQRQPNATAFPKDAKGDLQAADRWWRRYLAAANAPNASLATLAVQIYDRGALNKPKQAEQAALIVADASRSAQAYLQVVQYAVLAGDSRTADLAGAKAIDLAPKGQRSQVKQLVKQIKSAGAQASPQSG